MGRVSEEFKGLVSELFFAAQRIPKLRQLALYGSVAKGEEDRRSDVDLLLVFDTKEDPERTKLARLATAEIGRAFSAAKCERRPQLMLTNLRDVDREFIRNVSKEGIVVWGKPLVLKGEEILKPKVLFEYRVGGKSDPRKVRFYRALELAKAEKLRSALIVDPEDADDIEQIFKLNQVEYERKEFWVPRPPES